MKRSAEILRDVDQEIDDYIEDCLETTYGLGSPEDEPEDAFWIALEERGPSEDFDDEEDEEDPSEDEDERDEIRLWGVTLRGRL